MRFNLVVLSVVAALMAGIVAISPAAVADSAGAPLTTKTRLDGDCAADAPQYTFVRDRTREADESQVANWFFVGYTADSTGTFKTEEWVKNTYTDWKVYIYCNQMNHNKFRYTLPTKYVYKSKFVFYNCNPNCVPLLIPVVKSGWKSGYCGRGANGKVCQYT